MRITDPKKEKIEITFGTPQGTPTNNTRKQTKKNKMTISLADVHADQLKLYSEQHHTTPTATMEYLIEKYFTQYRLTRGRFPLPQPVTINVPIDPHIIQEYIENNINLIIDTDKTREGGQEIETINMYDPQYTITEEHPDQFKTITLVECNNYLDQLDQDTGLYYTGTHSLWRDTKTDHWGLIPVIITGETDKENTDTFHSIEDPDTGEIEPIVLNGYEIMIINLWVRIEGDVVKEINIITNSEAIELARDHGNKVLARALQRYEHATSKMEGIRERVKPLIELETENKQLKQDNLLLNVENEELKKELARLEQRGTPDTSTHKEDLGADIKQYTDQLQAIQNIYRETLENIGTLTGELVENLEKSKK